MSINLNKLYIEKSGGFEDFTLNLNDKLTVLIGDNGSGKTTVLSVIASLLETNIASLVKTSNDSIPLTLCKSHHNNSAYITCNYYNNGISLPVLVYYRCNTIQDENIEFSDLRTLETDQNSIYIEAFSNKSFDFNRFFNWFRWQEKIHQEIGGNNSYSIVRRAVYQTLGDGKNTFDNLFVTWLKNLQGDLRIDKNGTQLNINQLSSGEKTLLILVADLSRRLITANPESDNPLHGDGIVLIDEIDLHLHPSRQRAILQDLTSIFPNIQFIITTNSPIIVQSAENINLVLLEKKEEQITITQPDITSYKGWTVEEVLDELMGLGGGTLSDTYLELIKQFDNALDEDNYTKAKKVYDELDKILHPTSNQRKLLRIQMSSLIVGLH